MSTDSPWPRFRVFRCALLALLFSILSPGLGQVYNGQLLRGVLLYASFPAFLTLSGIVGLLHSYRGFVAFTILGVLLFGLIAVDAAWSAGHRPLASRPGRGWQACLLGASMLLVTVVALAAGVPYRLLGVHPYKIAEESMAPAVLDGDGIIVDLRYYNSHALQRGDVVGLADPIGNVASFSRVVALAGDVIEGTPNTIKVNGRMVNESYVEFTPDAEHDPGGIRITFDPLTVPAGRVFVMGDFRSHSYDSRRFGALDADRVKGKALYIYSSAEKSRIGRPVR